MAWARAAASSGQAGRNNNGHITTRHKGGGHKQHYRLVDFKRDKDGIPATVERLEYDPNRSAYIALLCYADGDRRFILAPIGLVVGQTIVAFQLGLTPISKAKFCGFTRSFRFGTGLCHRAINHGKKIGRVWSGR